MWLYEPAAYRLVAELQQLVRQPVDVADELSQRLFEVDGCLQDLVTAVHPRGVGGLQVRRHQKNNSRALTQGAS